MRAAGTETGAGVVLRFELELALPLLLAAGRRLIEHPRVRDVYPDYLVASHGVVRASVPLLERALACARPAAARDEAAAGLVAYLERHADEERGEDEWILEDLEALGRSREEALARPPSPSVAALVGAQYYWIEHHDPVAILGYIGALEGYPPRPADVEELIERTGYGREAFRSLVRHAEVDQAHSAEFFDVLDGLPLSERQLAVIGLSALHSVRAYTRVIEDVLATAE
jgi:hypothetical protein